MASGVKVDDEVKIVFGQISITKSNSEKLKFAVFKFSDDVKKIVIDRKGKIGDENWPYQDLVSSLPPNDVRYVAYEFDFKQKDGSKGSKLVLASWCPETSPIKKKMLCASSFNHLKTALGSQITYLEGDCLSEIDSQAVLDKLGGLASMNE
ncbi:actin depolymerizing factor [Plakobranchus ocellatus]|uniref:Actin depolymerizing factor n=1 Tax=Plakobranchus ocellatus TaxID=259542 RepID=A0AAV3ZW62_9GAST|nr:actin depolymerizing factor [Plakobranchus ocellatus]